MSTISRSKYIWSLIWLASRINPSLTLVVHRPVSLSLFRSGATAAAASRFAAAASNNDESWLSGAIEERNVPSVIEKGDPQHKGWWSQPNLPGIEERNAPGAIGSRRVRIEQERRRSDYRRGKRFRSTPPRSSGYYKDGKVFLPDGQFLGYDELYLAEEKNNMILYLNNLADEKQNDKSSQVFQYCQEKGYNYLCFDWLGRGSSSGRLREATLSRWASDTIWMLDHMATHVQGGNLGLKAVLVGGGVGAWVAVIVALQRPDLVRGIVGISADPDFTEDLLWAQLPEEDKQAIVRDGFREVKWGGRNEVYPITRELIEDAREHHLILRGGKDSLDVYCPVRLIHSLDDEEVPVTVPMKLLDCVRASDAQIYFSKVGGHSVQQQTRGAQWINPNKGSVNKIWINPNSVNFFRDALKQSLNECFKATQRDTLGDDLW